MDASLMGLLQSAKFFQKSMSTYAYSQRVYINDLIFHGKNDEKFVRNAYNLSNLPGQGSDSQSEKTGNWDDQSMT